MRNAILTISSAAKTATSGKFGAVLKSTLFAVLLAAASMAGAVPIPGTPVPITLQTFVVMLAALMLPWKQAGAAVLMYLAAGAAGLPVFAGGASTMALVGPSAGFLIGFLPAAVVTSLLKGKARVDSPKHAALTAARYLFACVAGCIVLDYLLGFIVQSAITGVAMPVVAIASMGFIVGDCIKAVVASLVAPADTNVRHAPGRSGRVFYGLTLVSAGPTSFWGNVAFAGGAVFGYCDFGKCRFSRILRFLKRAIFEKALYDFMRDEG